MDGPVRTLVIAAGTGSRLGEDKALVDLDGQTAIERIVAAHRRAGVESVWVVRRTGAAALPEIDARTVEVDEPPEMIDSVRAGLAAIDADDGWILFHPVDYPLSADGVLHGLIRACAATTRKVVLPICGGRPGHPFGLSTRLLGEIGDAATTSLRDVVRRDPGRVETFEVRNPWIRRDVDEPHDLVAARAWLSRPAGPTTSIMRAHRSRRAYHDVDVPDVQLEWIVDSARHCSTSSMMQAYAVVAVRDAARRGEIAQLCSDQEHIRQAAVFLAICADLRKVERACERHDKSMQGDSLEVFLQATIDAAILGQNIQLAAESEGLGACMIGAARNHPVAMAELLGLPPRVFVAFGMTMGWPKDDPLPRGRMPIGAVLHHERYDDARIDVDVEAADELTRAWARRTNSERGGFGGRPVNEQRGWSDRMARLWGTENPQKGRAGLVTELRQLGFGLELDSEED